MPDTLNEFIEKKVEELVENPEFRFHPSVMHFFRWSLRECAERTTKGLLGYPIPVERGTPYDPDTANTVYRVLKRRSNDWLGTNPSPKDND